MTINGLKRRGHTSIDEMLSGSKPVYVLNNTEPRALLICTVNDPISGKAHTLNFHRTFIPFCLTDMLPRDLLKNSIQLRSFLQKGVLKVIPEEQALEILDSEEGMEEYDRLMKSEFALGTGMTDRKLSMIRDRDASQIVANQDQVNNPSVDKSQLNLHPKVRTWQERVLAGELDGASLLTDLRIHATEFSKEDLEYMLTAQFPKEAKDFASKAISDGKFKSPQRTSTVSPQTDAYDPDWA